MSPLSCFRSSLLACLGILCALALGSPVRAQNGDECSTALTAVVGANGPLNLATMTPSANPPASDTCSYLAWISSQKDAWWYFWAESDGKLSLDFRQSNYDTSVVVYQGSCASLVRMGCDDDSGAPNSPYQSMIHDLPVNAGPVWIRVGGYTGATGTVNFALSFTKAGCTVGWGQYATETVRPPVALGSVVDLASGRLFSAALKSGGAVVCWGDNSSGAVNVPVLPAVRQVEAGLGHAVALTKAGAVFCWGLNDYGQCSVPAALPPISEIAAGSRHTLALRTDGYVVGWGSNEYGQLSIPSGISLVKAIACGQYHSIAIQRSGLLSCWGYNVSGQCNAPSGLYAKAVDGSISHSIALRIDGSVVCWGSNTAGESNVPASLGTCRAVGAGSAEGWGDSPFSVALQTNGTVVCWGSNDVGQCSPPGSADPATRLEVGYGQSFTVAYDLDNNGVDDVNEVPANDCNANGIHDSWDRRDETIEDCNGNGVGDECEKSLQVTVTAAGIGTPPFGAGYPRTVTIPNAAPALESDLNPVVMHMRVRGDFDQIMEYVTIRIGKTFSEQQFAGGANCSTFSPTVTLTMPPEEFNAAIGADGSLEIHLEPSVAVDPFFCAAGNRFDFDISYVGARPADCNGNGLLDSCEITAGLAADANANGIPDECEDPFTSCPTDTDHDGQTGASDLSGLLAAWGTANATFDFDSDGSVGASDLSQLLVVWGPCLPN